MLKLATLLSSLSGDRRGATAIEYGLIAAGIAIVIITALSLAGDNLELLFNNVAENLNPAE